MEHYPGNVRAAGPWEEGTFSFLLSTLQIWPRSRGEVGLAAGRRGDVVRNPQAQLPKPARSAAAGLGFLFGKMGVRAVPPLTGWAWG